MSYSVVVPDLRDGYVQIGEHILKHGNVVSPRGYKTTELEDCVIEVTNTRKLLPVGVGRELKPEIGFGEALLLVGGLASPSLMTSISPAFYKFMDGGDLHGAYGRRIRPQMDKLIKTLHDDRDSRQGIVQIWDPLYDQQKTRDTPCTLGFGFRIRDSKLHMTSVMRSQDFWLGLGYDLFMFGQLGWSVANTLGIEFASIRHHVMSLHVYGRDEDKIEDLHEFEKDEVTHRFTMIEPAGFGLYFGHSDFESTRCRAERIYNKAIISDVPPDSTSWTQSEVAYMNVLNGYERDTQTANFTS